MKAFFKAAAFSIVVSAYGAASAFAGPCGPGWGAGQTVGTLAGAAAGGVVGNQIGKGSGKDAATVAGVLLGGVVGNQAGASIDANNCPPPPPPAYAPPPAYSAPPPVVYQQQPVVVQPQPVVVQPAYTPPPVIVESEVSWGPEFWEGGRLCRSYSRWMVVNGVQQPYYGVACRDPHQGWIHVRAFDREHDFHDRDRDHRDWHDDHHDRDHDHH
jgi:surface antigen